MVVMVPAGCQGVHPGSWDKSGGAKDDCASRVLRKPGREGVMGDRIAFPFTPGWKRGMVLLHDTSIPSSQAVFLRGHYFLPIPGFPIGLTGLGTR